MKYCLTRLHRLHKGIHQHITRLETPIPICIAIQHFTLLGAPYLSEKVLIFVCGDEELVHYF